MDVIVHRAPGEAARDTLAVVIGEEDGHAAITALCDVVGDVVDDKAREPSYARTIC